MAAVTNKSNSLLRYPGGKAKITKFVANILERNNIHGTYIEPFAGGAGVAINLLLTNQIRHAVINDLDDGVYSFWKTVFENPQSLRKRIKAVPFDYATPNLWPQPSQRAQYWFHIKKRYQQNSYRSIEDKAFDFFMLNRMNVSGIIDGGPIGGLAQEGQYSIASRFNKQNLLLKLDQVSQLASRITLTNFEASHFLALAKKGKFNISKGDSLFFVDPPYYVQGKHLYSCYATDRIHSGVANELLDSELQWILTYDTAPQIDALYPAESVQKYEYEIQYSANKRGRFKEYLFSSNDLQIESFDNVALSRLYAAAPNVA
ncbi:MAG: DNA adenine methylase [Arcanobacterium sp.]|nr:DNA adenine methylase [Arcanobacterium sp.]